MDLPNSKTHVSEVSLEWQISIPVMVENMVYSEHFTLMSTRDQRKRRWPPSVFPCCFGESNVIRTTQRDTKGLHAKEDPDKERGCQNQTQTWRHVFWHSPTLTSQSSCYHPREERDHKISKKASASGTSSSSKRLGLQGTPGLLICGLPLPVLNCGYQLQYLLK